MLPTSPGWCSGVVLPRLTPGRKVLSPEAVCSRKPSLSEAARTDSPSTCSGAGVQSVAAGRSFSSRGRHRSRPVPVRRGVRGRRERPEPGRTWSQGRWVPASHQSRFGRAVGRLRATHARRGSARTRMHRLARACAAPPCRPAPARSPSSSYVAPIGGWIAPASHHRGERLPLLAHVAGPDHRVGAPADAADVDVVEQQPVDLDLGDALAGGEADDQQPALRGRGSAASR